MLRRLLIACLPTSLAILAAGASPAAAEDACSPPKVSASLAACAGAEVKLGASRRAAPVMVSQPQPRPPASAPGPTPPDPKLSAVAIRRGIASPRVVELGVQEIQGLETLLTGSPPGSADRPKIMKRLADDYVELEAASFRLKTEHRMSADEVKRKDPAKAAAHLAEATRAEKVEGAARAAAIRYYAQVKSQYPRWCQSPGTASGCVDETLYDLAYEHEQAGETDQARKDYLELIQTAPGSKYVPNAYLAFGELFFQEAQGDPSKWSFAEQSYKEVIKYPAPDNKVLGYARYKLAYVYWNKGISCSRSAS